MVFFFASCSDDDDNTWESYAEWRDANNAFYEEQKYLITPQGENYYTTITSPSNSAAQVLIKYLSDRSKTVGNLSPMSNSTVTVKYIGRLYTGEAFDSSYTRPDSVINFNLLSVISGWTIALQEMRVGDSARVVIPSAQGYGASTTGSIPPYSTLVFDVKLVDLAGYEIRP